MKWEREEGGQSRSLRSWVRELAEQALTALSGTGADYEGNASYNRGRALIDLRRCDDAVEPLRRSVRIGGTDWQERTRRDALKEARRCRKGHG